MAAFDTEARLIDLLDKVKRENASMQWHHGVRGLTLDLDFLAVAGATSDFLQLWEHGVPLGALSAESRCTPNHPSVRTHNTWAENEWSRLEELGKVSFFPSGAPRPLSLNVNPCGLLLKERAGSLPDASEQERWKARLILDLRKGRVNERVPHVGVSYGTVDMAVSRMHKGDFMFVVDLQDCFFNWRVCDADSYLLGFYSHERRQFGRYRFLPFGLSPAPGLNDRSIKELLRLLEQNSAVRLLDFVDDLLGAERSCSSAWAALERTVDFFLAAGVPVSAKPTGIRPPCTRQSWIGWIFDTILGAVTVAQE